MKYQFNRHLRIVKFLVLTGIIFSTFVYTYPAYAQGPVVDTAVDENDGSCVDGDCSLRDAIAVASPGETITFDSNYSIYLGSQLSIDKVLTIDGQSNSVTVSGDTGNDGSPNTRVFQVGGSGVVTLSNLSVVSGTVQGAGLRNDSGTVTINNSAFAGHIVTALYNNNGALTINNSVITGNTGPSAAGLGNFAGTVIISGSTFANNKSTGFGGGVVNQNNGIVTVENSTLSGNEAGSDSDGGIYNFSSGVVTISNSTLSGNKASLAGAGLYNSALATIANSTFSNNQSNGSGGGLYAVSGAITVTNSTFSGNKATSGNGGGINLASSTVVTINNSTLSGNEAGSLGGGLYSTSSELHLRNTIIANSTGADCSLAINSIDTNDTNLIEDNTCGPHIFGDPKLGPLQDHGGPTWTHRLLGGSPAINKGNNATCLATDQRGYPRNDGYCDIGAFESFAVYIPIVIK